MMRPDFISMDEIVEIHHDQIVRYGGLAGIRDKGLLASAAAMPTATYNGAFLHKDAYEMAAAYMYHLMSNHPFLDGDVRTGVVVGLIFLELNGISIQVEPNQFRQLIDAVCEGIAGKPEIAAFLRAHA